MRNVRIFFDGVEQDADDIIGLKSAAFTYRSKDENGENGFSFSPELELYDAAFDYIKANIIDTALPSMEQVLVRVIDDCCSADGGNPILLFDGKIDGSDVEWCEIPCNSCTVSIIDNSSDAIDVQCLKNTVIWDRKDKADGSGLSDGENSFRSSNLTSYCVDTRPSFMQEVYLILGFILIIGIAPALFILAAIVTVINVIIAAINLLGANIQLIGGDISFYDDVINLISNLGELIAGCGYRHKTPFIHSYLSNLCDVCGLSLQTSIFNAGGPYHNTMRLDAQYVPGARREGKANRNWEKNKPNLNGLQLLDELKQFNIDWRVSGGSLIIERKDYDFSGLWFDLANIQNENIISLCFSVTDEKPAAYAEYEYAKDGVDNTGDEVLNGWTQPVFDWNTPPNPAQSGLKSVNLRYGAAQFRQDSNRDDVSALDKPFYWAVYPALVQNQGVLLMEKGVCNFPKLLQWDGVSAQLEARILRYSSDPSQPTFDYNVDWWIKENYIDGAGVPHDTLYQRFFAIDNPRTTGIKTRAFTMQITATCDIVATLSPDKYIIIPVSGVSKNARIDEINFNTDTFQMTITGHV